MILRRFFKESEGLLRDLKEILWILKDLLRLLRILNGSLVDPFGLFSLQGSVIAKLHLLPWRMLLRIFLGFLKDPERSW